MSVKTGRPPDLGFCFGVAVSAIFGSFMAQGIIQEVDSTVAARTGPGAGLYSGPRFQLGIVALHWYETDSCPYVLATVESRGWSVSWHAQASYHLPVESMVPTVWLERATSTAR